MKTFKPTHSTPSPLQTLLILITLLLAACGGAPKPPQPQPSTPTLTLSSNKTEITLPDSLELAAAFDNLGEKTVSKLEFFSAEQKIGEGMPSFSWNATPESAGVAEGASATLSLSAKASLSDGSTLTSNSLSVKASATTSSFELNLEPSALLLENGQSGTVKVKLSSLNGFSADVEVVLVNPPAGVSAQALTIQGGDTEGTLTLSASGAAVGGPIEVMVKGQSGNKSATAPLALTIKAPPVAGTPELSFALDKAIITAPDTVQLSSNASNLGNLSVSKVEFYNGASKIGEDTTAPYGMNWNVTAQNSGVAEGNTKVLGLIAKATLSDGSQLTSGLQDLSVSVPAGPSMVASVQPFSISIQQGKSASVFLTLTRNVKGDASISLQNPLAGINLVPVSVFEGSSGTLLIIQVAQNAALGSKDLTIQASIGNLSASTKLQLNVTAPVSSGSYTLSVVAGNLSIEQGTSAAVLVKINRIGGYNKEVKLFAGIIPPGVTATFNPSTVGPDQTSSVLTLSASDDALAETPAQFAVFSQGAGENVQVDNFTLIISGIHGSFVKANKFLLSKEAIPTLSTRFVDVAATPDSKFLVGAMNTTRYNDKNFFDASLLRILPDGTDDHSFGMVNYGWEINYLDLVIGERMGVEYEVTLTGLSISGENVYLTGCARVREFGNDTFRTRQVFVNKRFLNNGSPDKNFGPGKFGSEGTRFYPIYSSNTISCGNAVSASSSGVYVAGYINTSPQRIGLVKVALDGTPANLYPTNTVIPNTSGGSSGQATCTIGDIQYVGGVGTGSDRERSVVLAYQNTGLFAGFSGDGIAAFDPDQGGSAVYDLQCLPASNQLLSAGYAKTASGKINFAVARLNTLGALDTSFSGDGKVTTAIGSGKDVAVAVRRAGDGGIVVAGYTTNPNGQRDLAIVKYKADGSLAQGFGIGGKVVRDLGGDEVVTGLTIAPNGTIAVVGNANNQGFIAFFKP